MNYFQLVLITLFCIGLSACQKQSEEVGSPTFKAKELWSEIDGFKSWPSPQGWEGYQESDSVHGDYVKNYINTVAQNNIKEIPVGSILVKEGYSDENDDSLRAITVMKKVANNNSLESWFSVRFNKNGKPTKINSGCMKCHGDAEGEDFIFINDHLK